MDGPSYIQLDSECDSCERACKKDMDLRALSNMAKNPGDYPTRKIEKDDRFVDMNTQQSGVLQDLGHRARLFGKSEVEVMREESAAREAARKARREKYLQEEAELLREKAVRDARRKALEAERDEFMWAEKETMKKEAARKAELDASMKDSLQDKMGIAAKTPPQKVDEFLKSVFMKDAKMNQSVACPVGVMTSTPPQKAQEVLKTVIEKDAKSRWLREENLEERLIGRFRGEKNLKLKLRLVDSSKSKPAEEAPTGLTVPPPSPASQPAKMKIYSHAKPKFMEKKIVSPAIASLDLQTPDSRLIQNPPAHLTKQSPAYNYPTKLGLSARHDLRLRREMERDAADFQPPAPKVSPPVKSIDTSPLNSVSRTEPTVPTPIPTIEAVSNIEMSSEMKGKKEEDWEDVVLGEGEDREEDADWEVIDV